MKRDQAEDEKESCEQEHQSPSFVQPVEARRSENFHPAVKRKNAARAITIMPKIMR